MVVLLVQYMLEHLNLMDAKEKYNLILHLLLKYK